MRDDLEKEIENLSKQGAEVESELDFMLNALASGQYVSRITDSSKSNYESSDLTASLQKVENFLPIFEAMGSSSSKLADQVEGCREVSDRLSLLVRRLDTIQICAQKALAATEDVLSMREFRDRLKEALREKDLPAAASYVRRVNDMDPEAAQVADEYDEVRDMERQLKGLIKDEFAVAIQGDSVDAVLLLCPLLQTLGLETTARDDFLSFMEKNSFIAISADASSVNDATDESTAYAQSLSNVFNTASLILQQYLPGVIQGLAKANGDVHFIRRLHARCEQEAGLVLKRYVKFRKIKEIITALKKSSGSGRGDKTSEVMVGNQKIGTPEMHAIMDEMALLIQYCCMYSSYLRVICKSAENSKNTIVNENGKETHSSQNSDKNIVVFDGPTSLDNIVEELITRYFIEGEKWIMSQSLHGVLSQLDECYYVLQRCGMRAVATNSLTATCTIIHLIVDSISTDMRKIIAERLASAVSHTASSLNDRVSTAVKNKGASDHGLSLPSSESATCGSSLALSTAFNTVEKCIRYTDRLNREVCGAIDNIYEDMNMQDAKKLSDCKESFSSARNTFAGILKKGCSVLGGKLQTAFQMILATALDRHSIRFEFHDEAFENQPALVLLPQSLVSPFDYLLSTCTHDLSESCKDEIIEELAVVLCERLERLINQSSFSFSGALKFEECVRALTSLFSSYTNAPIRSIFGRVREILKVLTTDSGDGSNIGNNSFSHITVNEAKAFAALRVTKAVQ